MPVVALATDAQVERLRAALITLAVDPAGFKAAPEPVRCPIYGGTIESMKCAAVNSIGETVGVVFLSTDELLLAVRREIIERCATRNEVNSGCIADVRVEIGEYNVKKAVDLTWVLPR
jgi:hypothetical protein